MEQVGQNHSVKENENKRKLMRLIFGKQLISLNQSNWLGHDCLSFLNYVKLLGVYFCYINIAPHSIWCKGQRAGGEQLLALDNNFYNFNKCQI